MWIGMFRTVQKIFVLLDVVAVGWLFLCGFLLFVIFGCYVFSSLSLLIVFVAPRVGLLVSGFLAPRLSEIWRTGCVEEKSRAARRKLESFGYQVCDALRCPGLHAWYTDALNEFLILPEMAG